MSFRKKKMLSATAVCLGMAVFMTQQIPAAALLQESELQKEKIWQETDTQQAAVMLKGSYAADAEQEAQNPAADSPSYEADCAEQSGSMIPARAWIGWKEIWKVLFLT